MGILIAGIINCVVSLPAQITDFIINIPDLDPEFLLILFPLYIALNIVSFLVRVYLLCGSSLLMLNVAKGRPATVGDIFRGGRYYWRMLICSFLYGLMVAAGFFACIVPGIILMLMFFPFALVLVDRDTRGVEALWKSKEITDGHKWILLVLGIVFIGLGLLGASACCIGLIWTTPAASLMITVAYLRMSGQKTVAG